MPAVCEAGTGSWPREPGNACGPKVNYYIKNAPAKGPKNKKVFITRFLRVTSPFP